MSYFFHNNRHRNHSAGLVAFLWIVCSVPSARAEERPTKIDFDRDVRPILAENCYACHGPDRQKLKAGLRLDRKEHALKELGSGAIAVVPGKSDESELIARITSANDDEHMPPAKTGKKLTEKQIQTLRTWIDQGAEWPPHWAYVAPKRHEAPKVQNEAWPTNAIDRFILARLEREGLQPSPEADRRTLIRRASLDLAGLPPTIQEVNDFLADKNPNAYEHVIDRLLASPRYGERMAQDWLDAARYADTNGYHIDNHRDLWKYREWVIDAFNKNMPFDRFTIEQFAGDLLPKPTTDQLIATGFHRNVMVNFEGGADPEEYLTKYLVDRVDTTATVYLGATLACAECHDHKYDPFTQKEFYRMYAFFNSVDEQGLDGSKESPAPRLRVPNPEQAAKLAELNGQLDRLDGLLKGPLPSLDAAQATWERERAEVVRNPLLGWKTLDPATFSSRAGATLAKQPDASVLASGTNSDQDVYEIVAHTKVTGIRAIRLEALTHSSLPNQAAARSDNGNFALGEFEVEAMAEGRPESSAPVAFVRASSDHEQSGFEVSKSIDGDPNSGWAVDGDKKRENRRAVFIAKTPIGFEEGTVLKIRLKFETGHPRHVIGRFRLSITIGDDPSPTPDLPAPITAILAGGPAQCSPDQLAQLRSYYRATVSTEGRALTRELDALKQTRGSLESQMPTTMVMRERMEPRKSFVLVRGNFQNKGEPVTPGVPAFLPPLPEEMPPNRLALAKWLVDPKNPLVARVTVNRFWQHYFGVGIVKTANDFGSQGEWPTHPELLDRLATDFIKSGWDVKALQKSIVMSSTYRQSSNVTGPLLDRDPDNRLLARGARFRLDAEAIRDLALSVSDLLDPRIGGPSVYPYQPPGIWEEVAFGGAFSSQTYVQSHGRDLYRRGLYTYWKRSVPYPSLTAFDAPNREVCVVARPKTTTPLQALVLLNDPSYVEAARALGTRMLKSDARDFSARLAFGFRLCTSRPPTVRESAVLERVLAEQLEHFRREPAAAAALLKVGESPRPLDLDPVELAAWTSVGNVLLNLDETITKN